MELNTSVIQYNHTGRRENGEEIHSQQSGLQVVSKQANSSPVLKSTRVDSEWQLMAEWTERTWPMLGYLDFLHLLEWHWKDRLCASLEARSTHPPVCHSQLPTDVYRRIFWFIQRDALQNTHLTRTDMILRQALTRHIFIYYPQTLCCLNFGKLLCSLPLHLNCI